MRWKQLWGRAVRCCCVLAAALVAVGCGVPDSSEPIDRGTAPVVDVEERTVAAEPQGPDDGTPTAQDVVERYFQAAAWSNSEGGNRPDALSEAEERVRAFLTADTASEWTSGNKELTLVRVVLGEPRDAGDGSVVIDATLEPVGVLNDVGAVVLASTTTLINYSFTVVSTDGGTHKRIAGVPTGLFFDVSYLTTWYDAWTIYFWAADSSTILVPDLRYMPTAVGSDKRPNEVWRWLTRGPSERIASAVSTLVDNVKLKGNLVTESGEDGSVLVVDLTSEAAGVELQTLVYQLRWSMRPVDLPIELRIESVKKDVDGSSDQYLTYNAAVWPDGQTEPERLFILDGKIRFDDEVGSQDPQILDDTENHDIITASVAQQSSEELLAFVRADADGTQRLWVGQLIGQGGVTRPLYQATDVVGASVSRPVWLTGTSAKALVIVDGKLIAVGVDGQSTVVESAQGVPANITAVSAAPDGRRLAIVADGQVGIASLRVDGDTISLRGFFALESNLALAMSVAWSSEDKILVGGRANSGSPLVELCADGTSRVTVDRTGLNGLVITNLVAYPTDPSQSGDRILAMFEANGHAYNVYGQQVTPFSAGTVTPSGSTTVSVPTAPLFYESI